MCAWWGDEAGVTESAAAHDGSVQELHYGEAVRREARAGYAKEKTGSLWCVYFEYVRAPLWRNCTGAGYAEEETGALWCVSCDLGCVCVISPYPLTLVYCFSHSLID